MSEQERHISISLHRTCVYALARSSRYPNFSAREGRDFKGKDRRWRDATTGILAGALFLLFLDPCRYRAYIISPLLLSYVDPPARGRHMARAKYNEAVGCRSKYT